MSSPHASFTLLDLPDQALAEITKHSRDRSRVETLNHQPFLRLCRQGRDGVLQRAARWIRLKLAAGDTNEAALQPLAGLLGRASGTASCEEFELGAIDGVHDQLLARLLESCQPWSSVLRLILECIHIGPIRQLPYKLLKAGCLKDCPIRPIHTGL
jgi:hypothetical protein